MRLFGQLLMALGAILGVLVAVAMAAHLGLNGVPWLLNVGLAKLGLLAAAGLMTGGAVSLRLAGRQQQRELTSHAESHADNPHQ